MNCLAIHIICIMKLLYILLFLQLGIANAQEFSITGKVVDASNNEPITGAIIRIQNIEKRFVFK